jgi:hypothetical protein
MRQVMPHRSNMVADVRPCKSFLHLKTGRRHHLCAVALRLLGGALSIPSIFVDT